MLRWSPFQGTREEWDSALLSLENYSLFQSFDWGAANAHAGWSVARMWLRDAGRVSALVQVLYRRFPLRFSLIWVPGGIVGQVKDFDFKLLKEMTNCRLFLIRCFFEYYDALETELIHDGWTRPFFRFSSGLTLYYYPSEDPGRLQELMTRNWRRNLDKARKRNLKIVEWENGDAGEICALYRQFESMKGLVEQHTLVSVQGVLRHLRGKLRLYKAFDEDGELHGFRGFAYFGDRAWELYAVSTSAGRKSSASHALVWRSLEEMRKLGVLRFDFSGADPEGNPGVYSFKKGLGAECKTLLGEWEHSNVPFLRAAFNLAIAARAQLLSFFRRYRR